MRNTRARQFFIPSYLGITDAMRLPYIDHKKRRHSPLNSEKDDITVKNKVKKKTYIVTII